MTIQTGTYVVPQEGFTGAQHELAIQAANDLLYAVLKPTWELESGQKLEKGMCHVLATITAYGKTLNDCPQGEAGATAYLIAPGNYNHKVFYIGEFKSGPLKCKTNPFTKGLTETSADGGAFYMNLPPSRTPYTFSATKPGVQFSSVNFLCNKDAFINLNPPHGPTTLAPSVDGN